MNNVLNICKRIVGGDFVSSPSNYPFMATMWYLDGEQFKFKSGAVYIGKRHFLTAGHCLKNRDIKRMIVRMGSTSLKKLPTTFRVVKAYVHPNFNSTSLQNDIAILEVDKDVNYDPIRLPCDHLKEMCYNLGHKVKVLGFGKDCDSSTQEHLYDLKEVDLKVVPIEESKYHRTQITNDMFLAGNTINGKTVDACTGDSGGPCIKMIKNNWVLIGIVSWGSGCGNKNLPGVYTRVLSYQNWIRNLCKFGGCGNH